MKFKYQLGPEWIERVSTFDEFANGAAQVTVRTTDGKLFSEVLISNGTSIIAMRGHSDLPFAISDISEIYQTDEDRKPKERSGWNFWDDWASTK